MTSGDDMRFLYYLVLTFIVLGGCSSEPLSPPQTADSIYANGRIWTGNPDAPWAKALAITGDKIMAIGSDETVSDWRGLDTDYYDLEGSFVSPGFQDSHLHIMYLSTARVDLAGAASLQDIQQRIGDFAAANPDLPWIEGFGWGYAAFPDQKPLAKHLDVVIDDRPVFIASRDGHMALANSAAMKMAGVNAAVKDPDNGRIVRGADGEPTGEFQENAMAVIRRMIPDPSVEQRYQAFRVNMRKAAASGITAFHEAGVDPKNIQLFERAQSEGQLLQRAELALRMVSANDRFQLPEDEIAAHITQAKALRSRLSGPYLRVRSIKAILDGTIDATTAAMFDNYVGRDTAGLPFWEDGTLKQAAAMYDKAGFQLIFHAIGDRAIAQALDVFDYVQQSNGVRDSRHRVEHAEMPRLVDLNRFRALGVTASTQPMFAYPDATVLENFAPLLGHKRAQHADNFALWDDANVRQVFGSDHPVMTLSVLQSMETAATRSTNDGHPPGGWYPEGRISVEAALRHYTSDSAWAIHDDKLRGTLEPGKFADFVVLSQNILDIDPKQLSETKVLRTVMGGQPTYIDGQTY